MTDDGAGWIVIPNWERFQHYRDRRPVWVKLYLSLLNDPDYLALTFHQRGVLTGLWMMYAASGGQVRDSTSAVSRQLSGRVTRETLDTLNHAGFIQVVASRPLAQRREEKNKKRTAHVAAVHNLPSSLLRPLQ